MVCGAASHAALVLLPVLIKCAAPPLPARERRTCA